MRLSCKQDFVSEILSVPWKFEIFQCYVAVFYHTQNVYFFSLSITGVETNIINVYTQMTRGYAI